MTDLRDQLALRRPHEIHDLLAGLRQAAGLTQQQLADRTGHKKAQVSAWETAAKRPNLDSLIDLLDALGHQITITPKGRP